ncbi:restriction endonuclease [Nocardia gipuzkoensis]|uniref:restriction endonuclease n=1 Tax=Nocardia gipuzkoensis TaxID=2749991 RepID=UPI003EE159D1
MPSLLKQTQTFLDSSSKLNESQAMRLFLPLLQELMAAQGFNVLNSEVRQRDIRLDYEATATPGGPQHGRIGIEYKHFRERRPTDVLVIRDLIRIAQEAEFDRIILISPSGFTEEALKDAQEHPTGIELLGRNELQDLARAADAATPEIEPKIVAVIRRVSEEFAKIVADCPEELDALEWRDLERMMKAVLDGLGFSAELTPASKDGGKDIILELQTEEGLKTYIVELKHWRSGKRVGETCVRDFVNVVARECREGGLFLSTYGYADTAFQSLTQIERTKVKFGGRMKIVSLCRSFVKAGSGLWSPDDNGLADVLFSEVLDK